MNVSALNIYPVKSCAGISIQKGIIVERGFEHDRRFLIVDDNRRFMTQRSFPQLALIRTAIEGDTLQLSAGTLSSLPLPLHPRSGTSISVTVWHSTVEAIMVSEEANRWLSDFLGVRCTLVFMPDASIRPLKSKYRRKNEHTSFADAFPFLLTTQASLDELNRRLANPVPMNRFRPNIVVEGTLPFEEDRWKAIQIGLVRLRVAKPCARCSTTTVDQSTGVRDIEPLHTLSTFRRHGGDVLFGHNLIHEGTGIISVGDEVIVR